MLEAAAIIRKDEKILTIVFVKCASVYIRYGAYIGDGDRIKRFCFQKLKHSITYCLYGVACSSVEFGHF